MERLHNYELSVIWTGNRGKVTEVYSVYSREHLISSRGTEWIKASSDQSFRGGTMLEDKDGGGRFTGVILSPKIVFRAEPKINPDDLHDRANKLCFIANSCNLPVRHTASFTGINEPDVLPVHD